MVWLPLNVDKCTLENAALPKLSSWCPFGLVSVENGICQRRNKWNAYANLVWPVP